MMWKKDSLNQGDVKENEKAKSGEGNTSMSEGECHLTAPNESK